MSSIYSIRNFLSRNLVPRYGLSVHDEILMFVEDMSAVFGDPRQNEISNYEIVLWMYARFDEYREAVDSFLRCDKTWRNAETVEREFKSAIIADLE
jgi:hypothetical protein